VEDTRASAPNPRHLPYRAMEGTDRRRSAKNVARNGRRRATEPSLRPTSLRLAAAQGYDVAISFVSNETAALAMAADVEATGRRALPVRADSADPEQVAQLFAAIDREFGRIDVLVNNAAVLARQSRLEDLGVERMQRIFAVNAIGPILCAQQAAKRMSYRHNGRGGSVINVSSAAARL
jgi:NAD(P)-dependent dehydrogenase (short-subunit alcohol dehydrogenase family)